MHQKSGKQGAAPNDDLKNFYIKVALNKESIKAVSKFVAISSSSINSFCYIAYYSEKYDLVLTKEFLHASRLLN